LRCSIRHFFIPSQFLTNNETVSLCPAHQMTPHFCDDVVGAASVFSLQQCSAHRPLQAERLMLVGARSQLCHVCVLVSDRIDPASDPWDQDLEGPTSKEGSSTLATLLSEYTTKIISLFCAFYLNFRPCKKAESISLRQAQTEAPLPISGDWRYYCVWTAHFCGAV
jgi:hypothetical protein